MWVKNYKLKTAPMENVLTPAPEPIDSLNDDFVAEELYIGDSIPEEDLTQVASNKPEQRYYYGYKRDDQFNRDMEYYVKYFGHLMPDNRPTKERPVLDSLLENASLDTLGVETDSLQALPSVTITKEDKRAAKAAKKEEKRKEKERKRQEKFNYLDEEFSEEDDFEEEDNLDDDFEEDELPSLDDEATEEE